MAHPKSRFYCLFFPLATYFLIITIKLQTLFYYKTYVLVIFLNFQLIKNYQSKK